MPFSRNNEELAAQAETLRLLSFLFDSPDPSLLSIIGSLRELYRVDRHAVQLLDGMAASLERDDLVSLKVDHARLFIGPLQMLAPPYASLHLEAGDRVEGEVTRRIARSYRASGLDLSAKEKRPADHIGYLLEFLYYLAFRAMRDGEEGSIDHVNRFAEEYVLSWTPRLFALMKEGAATRYFQCFAALGLECLPV
ncbi:TorD/DmsD family molecular chaperone [Gordonibacter massiliensis (ex Traore et al. 2017)]|uniref:Molecular chaperone TorD family protein n=1 Tax=Gordonibacter massiliensis (ex Traore et al. 2017) TaxID=1841863 RepID=A0A842JGH5_9ACTN|nr:molecular chaperone TorD family protein [Gordonibacter massiliensis (ex Traore et al. 2017)]MBC2888150.1 molecular chaperone TorD family protein [Gordonibacter massiliensis (ex Traore et al. 2017)]